MNVQKPSPAPAEEVELTTTAQRLAESKPVRIGFSALLIVLHLVNLILAATAIHVSAPGLAGSLGFEILLSILTAIFTGIALWQPLAHQAKGTANAFLALSATATLLWSVAVLALIIKLGTVADAISYVPPGAAPGTSPSSYKPAVGCVILSLFFVGVFGFNTIYVYVVMRKMWPKYAEVGDQSYGGQQGEGEGAMAGARVDTTGGEEEEEAWRPDMQMESGGYGNNSYENGGGGGGYNCENNPYANNSVHQQDWRRPPAYDSV